MSARAKDTYCVHSVENALALLEALCEEGDEVSLSRLSERLDIKKATIFRLLATFENRGYVEREEGSRKYRLGLSAYEIGQKFLSRMELLRKARPVMEQLVRECNEAAYIVVRRDDEALFLDMVDGVQQVKIISLAGRRFPLLKTAAGKALLAFAASPPPKKPQETPPDLAAGEASTIRQCGACIERNGVGDGITSLAVPLFNARGETAGALALLGPEFRMPPDKIEKQLLPAVKLAGEVISSKLGYLGHYFEKGNLGNGLHA